MGSATKRSALLGAPQNGSASRIYLDRLRSINSGFSMGGTLALHTAYRWDRKLAGVFVCSSFLNHNSIVYSDLKGTSSAQLAPLLQIHGDSDDLVHLEWGQETHNTLKELGVQGEFHIMEKLDHSINKRGIRIIKEWIEKILPEI